MIHMEDRDEEENFSSDDLEDVTDSFSDDDDDDDYGDDDDDDDDDNDDDYGDDRDDDDSIEDWPDVDSNGKNILSEDYLVRCCSSTFHSLKGWINQLHQFLQSGSSEKVNSLEEAKELLCYVEITLVWANTTVKTLLSRFSQSSKRETILQIYAHATAEVAAVRAELDALG